MFVVVWLECVSYEVLAIFALIIEVNKELFTNTELDNLYAGTYVALTIH